MSNYCLGARHSTRTPTATRDDGVRLFARRHPDIYHKGWSFNTQRTPHRSSRTQGLGAVASLAICRLSNL